LLDPLSQRPGARNLVKQLERCGPSGGANYEEARGAESPADFVHKVTIALKEVRETRYWLRLVLQAGLLRFANEAYHGEMCIQFGNVTGGSSGLPRVDSSPVPDFAKMTRPVTAPAQ
jgi:four helix bundle protein